MTIDDYEEVIGLWKNTQGMGLNNLDDSKEGISFYLKRNPNTCFIAKDEGKIAGVILSGHDGRRGFIYHTTVAASQRRKGIGKKLVDLALSALREEGINKVALVVFKKNELGNKFWKELGFIEREDLVYRNKVISKEDMKAIKIG
jgi:ribosomal protein S18 acetylase RimI-like enzyme